MPIFLGIHQVFLRQIGFVWRKNLSLLGIFPIFKQRLNELFKSTSYDDSLFDSKAIAAIESAVFIKTVRGTDVPYMKCQVRDKEIRLTPEEAVRQLYLYVLIHTYSYPTDRIQLEAPIHFGREVKRADIAIMDKDRPTIPYIIVELKKPKLTEGKEQLKSYCNATGAPIGVWTNGEQISYYNRKDPNFFEAIRARLKIANIPKRRVFFRHMSLI